MTSRSAGCSVSRPNPSSGAEYGRVLWVTPLFGLGARSSDPPMQKDPRGLAPRKHPSGVATACRPDTRTSGRSGKVSAKLGAATLPENSPTPTPRPRSPPAARPRPMRGPRHAPTSRKTPPQREACLVWWLRRASGPPVEMEASPMLGAHPPWRSPQRCELPTEQGHRKRRRKRLRRKTTTSTKTTTTNTGQHSEFRRRQPACGLRRAQSAERGAMIEGGCSPRKTVPPVGRGNRCTCGARCWSPSLMARMMTAAPMSATDVPPCRRGSRGKAYVPLSRSLSWRTTRCRRPKRNLPHSFGTAARCLLATACLDGNPRRICRKAARGEEVRRPHEAEPFRCVAETALLMPQPGGCGDARADAVLWRLGVLVALGVLVKVPGQLRAAMRHAPISAACLQGAGVLTQPRNIWCA